MTITTDEYWPCLECGSESAATCLQPEGCAASRERIIAISAELEHAKKELAEANGWLKHYRKAEPEQYAELRKKLERYDRRSESSESLGWDAEILKAVRKVVEVCDDMDAQGASNLEDLYAAEQALCQAFRNKEPT